MFPSTGSDIQVSSPSAQVTQYADTPRVEDVEELDGRDDEDMVLPSGAGGELDSTGKPVSIRINPRRLLALLPILAVAGTLTMAPRLEIYTDLACNALRPDLFNLHNNMRAQDSQGVFYSVSDTDATSVSHFAPFQSAESTSSHEISLANRTAPPTRRNLCASDPVVQATVAKLTTIIQACSGVLVCATTGWWGSFSDRHGRTPVLVTSTLSLLASNLVFFLAVWCSKHVPNGYWFLLVGPVIEGLFGGLTVGILVIQSYIADITDENNRSSAFAFALGLLYSGMALGPSVGSLIIHFTGQTISVFYAAAFLNAAFALLVWTLIPEALSQEQMDSAKAALAADLDDNKAAEGNLVACIAARSRRLLSFLRPLAVFLPVKEPADGNPLKKRRRDWSLTLIALAYGISTGIQGSYSYKFLYATSTFHWTSEYIGYWLSAIGATRAVYLAIILPVLIKLLKPLIAPKLPVVDLANETAAPLIEIDQELAPPSAPPSSDKEKEAHSPSFDLNLARVSLLIDMTGFSCMGLSSSSSLPFASFGIMGSFATGFSPAADSLTLALYKRRGGAETGKLFGALAVLQTVHSQVLGPSFFGFVYIKTIPIFPPAIFFVSTLLLGLAFLLLSLIRLPKGNIPPPAPSTYHEETSSTLVDI